MVRSRGGQDLYATLGVPRDADTDAVKSAYRKQAQRYHPDRNSDDPAAEEQFKRVSAAYAVLSDKQRRKAYDEFGDIALDPNFDADKAHRRFGGGFGGGDFASAFSGQGGGFQDIGDLGSLFEDLLGGGARQRGPRPRRGANLEASLELDFTDAALGSEQRLSIDRPTASGTRQETLSVRIPPGVGDGARIRLAGKGAEGSGGAPPGDLFANIRIRPHPVFRREGHDLYLDVPVSFTEAVRGADIEIPTLTGRVTLHVPAHSDGGTRLRLRAKGVPMSRGGAAGDLYVTIQIRVPRDLDSAAQTKLDELLSDDPNRWRRELFRGQQRQARDQRESSSSSSGPTGKP